MSDLESIAFTPAWFRDYACRADAQNVADAAKEANLSAEGIAWGPCGWHVVWPAEIVAARNDELARIAQIRGESLYFGEDGWILWDRFLDVLICRGSSVGELERALAGDTENGFEGSH